MKERLRWKRRGEGVDEREIEMEEESGRKRD